MNLQGRHRYNRHKEKVGKRLEGDSHEGNIEEITTGGKNGGGQTRDIGEGLFDGVVCGLKNHEVQT